MTPRIIAVANHKGGVGKTSLVTNVGAAFARKGYNTLLIDLDGQANLTDSYLKDFHGKAIGAAVNSQEPLAIVPLRDHLSLAPGDIQTTLLEKIPARQIQRTLQAALPPYDIVLIDTPPSIGALTICAFSIADEVVIPLTAELSSFKGMNSINRLVSQMAAAANTRLHILGAVLSMYDERLNLSQMITQGIEASYKGMLFHTTIRRNVAIAEAGLKRTDIFSYSPHSNGAADYTALTEEMIQRLHL